MEQNALISIANNFEELMADGFTGNEPFFDAGLMREAAKAKIKELEALPECDLSTEEGRKQLRAAIKPVKQLFSDFEKNIKVIKKSQSDIPKKCDASSKAVRDVAEPEFERIEKPFAELKAQEALTEKWWKKEGIPFDRNSLGQLLADTEEAEPLPFSSAGERADFGMRKAGYIEAVRKAIERMDLAEKAEREEKERRFDEAVKAESEKQRAAANPPSAYSPAKEPCAGAPPALSGWEKSMIENESVSAIEDYTACRDLAEAIVFAITQGRIPHVRFHYE